MDVTAISLYQVLFNIAVGIAGAFGGWYLHKVDQDIRTIREQEIKALHEKDDLLRTEVHALSVLVAGGYVKRDEMERAIDKLGNALFDKLNQIDSKLDRKADKHS